MRRIGIEERRARLGVRHRLATGAAATTPAEAAASVVAIHATDPASVFLALRARTKAVTITDIEEALYEQRTLVRMLGMRRTMFVAPVALAPAVQSACADALALSQRRRYAQLLADGGVGDTEWLKKVEDATEEALQARGIATGAQLSTDVPLLRTQVHLAEGKSYGAKQNITSWILLLLAAQGRIVRGRPVGSILSTQWRWSPAVASRDHAGAALTAEAGRAELVREWLRAFGPGTVADLRWWTGWTAAHVNKAVAEVGAVPVDLDGVPGLVLPDDLEPVAAPKPWVALLPALDATPMGWTQRSWYLGPHAEPLFDRSGNIGPTIWCDGRIVGGWAQRADGEVAYRLLEDIGKAARTKVAAAAASVTEWLGPVRVTPRFRTPLERELVAP